MQLAVVDPDTARGLAARARQARYPAVPVLIYIAKSAALLERISQRPVEDAETARGRARPRFISPGEVQEAAYEALKKEILGDEEEEDKRWARLALWERTRDRAQHRSCWHWGEPVLYRTAE